MQDDGEGEDADRTCFLDPRMVSSSLALKTNKALTPNTTKANRRASIGDDDKAGLVKKDHHPAAADGSSSATKRRASLDKENLSMATTTTTTTSGSGTPAAPGNKRVIDPSIDQMTEH